MEFPITPTNIGTHPLANYNLFRRRMSFLLEDCRMTEQRSLWDPIQTEPPRASDPQQAEKDEVRRRTIKRLRASGHWLTLLRVARTIPQPFTLNDISVAVWKACPEFFGMKGYPYPDNHKVHYILYGDRGLIAKGLIHRVSEGLFCVPETADVEAFLKSESEGENAPPLLSD